MTLLAVLYFVIYAAKNWSQMPALSWDGRDIVSLAMALGLYCGILLATPIAWHRLLHAAGATPSVAQVLAISLLSQFAKYIPGNVAHHIGRVALARSYGLDISRVIVTMTLETGWVVFAAVVVGSITLLTGAPALFGYGSVVPPVWQLSLIGLAAAAAPYGGIWLLNRWRSGLLSRFFDGAPIDIPPARVMVFCFATYVFNYLLMGGCFYLLASRLFGLESADFWFLTGIFAVAWIAGFVMPGAPGGLGVREAILVLALGPLYGEGTAVALTIVLRALTVAGDGLGFLGGVAARSFAGRER